MIDKDEILKSLKELSPEEQAEIMGDLDIKISDEPNGNQDEPKEEPVKEEPPKEESEIDKLKKEIETLKQSQTKTINKTIIVGAKQEREPEPDLETFNMNVLLDD